MDKGIREIFPEVGRGDSVESLKEKVISSAVRSVGGLRRLVPARILREGVRRIVNAERMFFIGLGSSSFVAFDAYHKFLRLGMRAEATSDSHIMNMMASHAAAKDLVFAVSHSGESRDILDCLKLARANGAGVIALTGSRGSSITRLADVVLLSAPSGGRRRPDPLVSQLLQLVVIDILYLSMMLEMGPVAAERIQRSRLAVAGKKL